MIPVRYWVMIGAVIALVVGFNHLLTTAYDRGVSDQIAIQTKADDLRLDLNNAEKVKIEQDAQQQVNAANAAADRSAASADRLRNQLDTIKRIASNASGTFPVGTTATDAVRVLADLLRQCGERYQRVAKFADAARNAGATCERSYDSLTKSPH